MVVLRLLWGTGKLAVKYVIIPLAVTAIAAAVLGELAERVKVLNDEAADHAMSSGGPEQSHLAMAA